MTPRIMGAVLLLVALGGCAKEGAGDAAGKLESERERDSVLGQSKIPGATGVGKAMKVADSAGSRVQLQDSIATSE